MFAHLLLWWSSSNHLLHPADLRRLSIFVAHSTSFPARLLPCEDCLPCPVVPFRGNIFAWNSLVCLDVGFFICRFCSMHFHLEQKSRCSRCFFFPEALRSLPIKCMSLALLLTSLFCLYLPIFLQLLAALDCRTNKVWVLLQGCCAMPRRRRLVPDGSSWIIPLRVPPSSVFFAGSHHLLPLPLLFGWVHHPLWLCLGSCHGKLLVRTD